KRLGRDTSWFIVAIPFCLMALYQKANRKGLLITLSFLISTLFMYAPASRVGGQYWLLIMPPMAIFLGAGFALTAWGKKINPRKTSKITQGIALALVLLVQYLPFRTHVSRYP